MSNVIDFAVPVAVKFVVKLQNGNIHKFRSMSTVLIFVKMVAQPFRVYRKIQHPSIAR